MKYWKAIALGGLLSVLFIAAATIFLRPVNAKQEMLRARLDAMNATMDSADKN